MVKVFAWNYKGTNVNAAIRNCEDLEAARKVSAELFKEFRNVMIARNNAEYKLCWNAIGAQVTE